MNEISLKRIVQGILYSLSAAESWNDKKRRKKGNKEIAVCQDNRIKCNVSPLTSLQRYYYRTVVNTSFTLNRVVTLSLPPLILKVS